MFDYLFTAISYDVKELYNLAFVTIFCLGVSGGNKTKKMLYGVLIHTRV